MELLTAVNLILPKLGEHPVTSITVKHPTLAIILPEIDNILVSVLSKGWWFNTYEYTARRDPEGYIALGTNILSFIPDNRSPMAAQRGIQLFNTETMSFKWDRDVTGLVTQKLEFNVLPESAAQHIMYSALVTSYITDLGSTNEIQAWQILANSAYTMLLSEHLRNRKYSTAKSPRYQRLLRARKA